MRGSLSGGLPTLGDRNRIRELDGLRGVAIGMVVLFHFLQNTMAFPPGSVFSYVQAGLRLSWTGVDLFFVLSGFLIGGILLDSRDSTNYYSVFYKRRFFRIIPIYLVTLLLGAALVSLRLGPTSGPLQWLTMEGAPWYAYLTFTQNFWMAHAGSIGSNGLAMTWSLAVEEQFYVMVPLYIRAFTRRWLTCALVIGICSAPLLRTLLFHFGNDSSVGIYTMTLCRADALLLGVLAAVLLRDERWRKRIRNASVAFYVLFPSFIRHREYSFCERGIQLLPC